MFCFLLSRTTVLIALRYAVLFSFSAELDIERIKRDKKPFSFQNLFKLGFYPCFCVIYLNLLKSVLILFKLKTEKQACFQK